MACAEAASPPVSADAGGAAVNLNRLRGGLGTMASRAARLGLVSLLGVFVALAGCADSGPSNDGLVNVDFGGSDDACHDCYDDDDDWAAMAFFSSLLGLLFVLLIVVGVVAAVAGAAGGRGGDQQQQQQVIVVRDGDAQHFDQRRW